MRKLPWQTVWIVGLFLFLMACQIPVPTPVAIPLASTPASTPTPVLGRPPVAIENSAFKPDYVGIGEIHGGVSVTWINRDSVPHTVTGQGFDSGPLATGATFTKTFTAGTYDYQCTIHPTMKGILNVLAHTM